VSICSGMFPLFTPAIPNLELGYTYSFGPNVRQGRAWGDFVFPVSLGCSSVFFGEAHGEFDNFGKRPEVTVTALPGFTTTLSTTKDRIDLSFGGGYRTILNGNMMVGANAFYDSSRLFEKWYSSSGLGLEMAVNTFTNAAVDLNINWYGNFLFGDNLVNPFRNRGGSFDVEAGYSQGLVDNTLDLRIKGAGYKFDVGDNVYGWRAGADLTTRDGLFSVKYEYGQDRINDSYQSIGANINLGFQLENVLAGGSPITMPSPVFVNPRNLGRLLDQKVKRNWHQPAAVVAFNHIAIPAGGGGGGCDRTVAPFPLAVVVANVVYGSNLSIGALFPLASLNPAGHIVVTPTLPNPLPAGTVITVAVIGDNNVTDNAGVYVSDGIQTSPPITLTAGTPPFNQSAFITFNTPPAHITITIVGSGNFSGAVTSACIKFNQ
jgi:hypothetical protein